MSSEIAIKVENLGKCYHIYDQPRDRLKQMILPRLQRAARLESQQYFREFWALRDVGFEVKKGETVGIVGRNGSGKSTLLQMICGTLNPTTGTIYTQGRIAALLELGSGFNPEFTGRENVYLNGAVLGLSNEEIDSRFDEIARFADIGDFIDQPVKAYSSGMMVRLAFAVAASVSPEVLIVDEALSVGDLSFQNKCLRHIKKFIENGGTTLFVSHSPAQVMAFCNRAYWLDKGTIRAAGDVKSVVTGYVNFMRDGFERAGEVKTEEPQSKELVSNCWTEIDSEHEVDAREGHRITAFSLTDSLTDEPVAAIFELPKKVTLRMRVSTVGVEKPLIGVGLFGTLNLPIVHFNNASVGADLGSLSVGSGHEIVISFELPVIADGEYMLQFGLDTGEIGSNTMLCHVRAAMKISVACQSSSCPRQYGLVPVNLSSVVFDLCSTGGDSEQ